MNCFSLAGLFALLLTASSPAGVDFSGEIRPLLSKHCIACHGPDEGDRKAGLRLDTYAGATGDLGGYQAVVPGRVEAGELIYRVTSKDPDEQMPPPEHGEKLKPAEVALLKQWIAEGADYEKHWSFSKPVRPKVPMAGDSWAQSPIDRFIAEAWEGRGLNPSPMASRAALIRRVSLDLTGLPPTLNEAEAFAKDKSPEAFEKVVDRLLASPRFGEHWAAMWLDLARYADTMGYASDNARTIWVWRDWVIRAFNANMPFDRFTVEQLAGDLLPGATDDQILATAFHRNTLNNTEGGTNDEEFRTVAVKDRVNTTVNV